MQDSVTAQPWCQYRHPSVRDLAWLLFSPPLFSNRLAHFAAHSVAPDPRVFDWLQTLDERLAKTPNAYPQILRTGHTRLGLYAESLLQFYFNSGTSALRLITHNLRITDHGKTLGECDFVVQDRNARFVHIELAVKFYLKRKGKCGHEWQTWLGPLSKDRLDLKLGHMINHQLPITKTPPALAALSRQTQTSVAETDLESRHMVKGCLFYHFSERSRVLPQHANASLLCGYWLHRHELNDALRAYPEDGKILRVWRKMDWLSGPVKATSCDLKEVHAALHTHDQKAALIGKAPTSLMLSVLDTQDRSTEKRLLVVNDYWPDTSSPSRRI